MAAIDHGKSVDTSMGMTPLEGVIMGTRSGNVDPAVLQYIMNSENLSADQMLDILNKKSGLLGISGVSSDMRDVEGAAAQGNKDAQTAIDMLYRGIKKYIGSYALSSVWMPLCSPLASVNNKELREAVMANMDSGKH